MTTVYEINGTTGKISAAFDVVFGWSIQINDSGWAPLKYDCGLTAYQIDAIRSLFVGSVYPNDLREALDDAHRQQVLVEQMEEKHRRADEMARQESLQVAEANAVSAIEEKLKMELRIANQNHQDALYRLAHMHLRRVKDYTTNQDVVNRCKRISSLLMDKVLVLSLRPRVSGDIGLTLDNCQVSVQDYGDPELVELLDGIIPFTK